MRKDAYRQPVFTGKNARLNLRIALKLYGEHATPSSAAESEAPPNKFLRCFKKLFDGVSMFVLFDGNNNMVICFYSKFIIVLN